MRTDQTGRSMNPTQATKMLPRATSPSRTLSTIVHCGTTRALRFARLNATAMAPAIIIAVAAV
jgi:hypothetical protein